jgi:hypothetical protein
MLYVLSRRESRRSIERLFDRWNALETHTRS